MLGAFGLSQKLPGLPNWVASRLAHHIKVYREQVRPFIHAAEFYRLTDQPRRDGTGERWCAFQYSLPDEDRHLLFVFRLPGAEKEGRIRLSGLSLAGDYSILGLEGEIDTQKSGRELTEEGLLFQDFPEEWSMVISVSIINHSALT